MARTVLALILAIACLHAAHAENATERTITVTGNGALQKQSDTAKVSVTVSNTQNLASDARQNVSATVSSILSALSKEYGDSGSIAVTTASLNVYPQNEYNSTTGAYKRIGYQFSQGLTISIRNVTTALLSGVIDVAVNQGEDVTITSISFGLSSTVKGKMWLEGRNAAVADARDTAQLYAQALGGGLGPLYNMQEVSGSSGDSSDSRSGSDAGAPPPVGNGTVTPAVSIGQQTVTIQVAAVYLLLPAAAPAPAPGASSALRAAGPAASTAGR